MANKSIYPGLAEKYRKEINLQEKVLMRISLLRLATFFGGLVIIYISFLGSKFWGITSSLAFVILFLFLLKRYNRHANRRDHLLNLEKINLDEAAAMDWDFSAFDGGSRYSLPAHDFTFDIDIFGEGSLFQYLNRTVTGYGSDLLASWLSDPYKTAPELGERQQVVAGMAQKFGWRQEFMASGVGKRLDKSNIDGVNRWLGIDSLGSITKIQRLLSIIMPSITFLLLGLTIGGIVQYPFLVTAILANMFIVGSNLKKTNKIYAELTGRYQFLDFLGVLLELVENEKIVTPLIGRYREKGVDNLSGIVALKRLGRIIHKFDNRNNVLVAFLLNSFILWDLQCLKALVEWKEKYREQFPVWLEIIGEVDAFASLANFSYNNPEFAFPEKSTDGTVISAKGLGHPLICGEKRVENDFSMGKSGEIIIVTGANMAGKSTFLRTVAVNFILAMVGAPVCAAEMRFRAVKLFTSMRTTDSLHSNESYFYAELKRLKILGERLEGEEELFFVLDEILKGTNSDDKRLGSVLFLKKIIALNGTGMIATHDTSLGDLEVDFPGTITNSCIEIEVDGPNIRFDYKLKPGIAKNKNAVLLMQQLKILG